MQAAGLKLTGNQTLNQLPDSALALGNSLRDLVPNPFAGQVGPGILSNPTVARAQLLRPFPQFDNVTAVTLSNCGNGRSNCARATVGLESIPGPTCPANGFGTRSRSELPRASAESGNWLSV